MTAAEIGFVVAGGQSRRMGRDKALLPWGDATLLAHAVLRLQSVCRDVRLLTGPEPRYAEHGLPVIVDAGRDFGPLAGLLAGLRHAGPRTAVFLAVDVPFAPAALLRHLLRCVPSHDAVVPVTARGPEPLCAAYGPACASAIERRLDAGERKLTCFWPDVRVRQLDAHELRGFGDPERLFANANTPEEYERLLKLAAAGAGPAVT